MAGEAKNRDSPVTHLNNTVIAGKDDFKSDQTVS